MTRFDNTLDRIFVGACHLAGKLGKHERLAIPRLREKLELAGLRVTPGEVHIFCFPLPLLAYTLVLKYPDLRAERVRLRISGKVPALVSYMSMSMRMNPNLERAAIFTAENLDNELGRGQL